MAGKTRKHGQRAGTPTNMARVVAAGGPKGHMGVKSSAYCVTDSKLISQYMVQDHMTAHYKKIIKAKSAVDTAPPKAWLVSQKVRDQARRAAINSGKSAREKPPVNETFLKSARPSSRTSSEVDRDEMYAMWASLGEDELDGPAAKAGTNTTLEVHPPASQPSFNDTAEDMKFVNRILNDSHNSPSHYHNPRSVQSNIPGTAAGTHIIKGAAQQPNETFMMNDRAAPNFNPNMTTNLAPNMRALTPRSKDLLDTNANHFTDEKPFQPRTLRTNTQSRLSEFKYYNAPKKRAPAPAPAPAGPTPSRSQGVPRGTLRSTVTLRSGTPMTMGTYDSTDIMLHETLMSRDHSAKTPTGIPPLDISLDADHMKWLKEQSHKANTRSSGRQVPRSALHRSDVTGHPRPTSAPVPVTMNLPTSSRLATGEEELQYLAFVTDVTNDVLDRGIFTNRVLKQVFQHHLEKRKGELKVSRMRELLLELQRDLGIPPADLDLEDGLGMATMPGFDPRPHEMSLARAAAFTKDEQLNGTYQEPDSSSYLAAQKVAGRPPKRDDSPTHYGRPPLPKSRSVSQSRHGSAGSFSRENSREELKDVASEEGLGNLTLGMTMKRDGALDGLQAALVATLNETVAQDEEDAFVDTDYENTHRSGENTNRDGATSRADTVRSDHSHQQTPSPRSRRRASRRDQSGHSSRRTSKMNGEHSGETTRRSSRSSSGEKARQSPESTHRSSRTNTQRSPESTRRSSKANTSQSPEITRRSSKANTVQSPESTRRSSKANSIQSPESTRRSSKANSIQSPESTRRSSKANSVQSPESTRRSSKANSIQSPGSTRRSSKANSDRSGESTRRSSRAASPVQEATQSARSVASIQSADKDHESEATPRSPPKPSPRRSISSAKAPDTARSVPESNEIESESIGVSELDEDLDEDF